MLAPFQCCARGAHLVVALQLPGGRGATASIARCHGRLASKPELALKKASNQITALTQKLGLPQRVLMRAQKIYHDAVGKHVFRRQNAAVTTTSTVYAACRVEGITRSLKEVALGGGVAMKHVGRCFNALKRQLELQVQTVKSGDFIARVCNAVGLPMKLQTVVEATVKAVGKRGLCHGRNPLTVAATCTWIACELSDDHRGRLEDIVKACDVTEAVVRKVYQGIYLRVPSLLPPAFAATARFNQLPPCPGSPPSQPAKSCAPQSSPHEPPSQAAPPKQACVRPPAGSNGTPTAAPSSTAPRDTDTGCGEGEGEGAGNSACNPQADASVDTHARAKPMAELLVATPSTPPQFGGDGSPGTVAASPGPVTAIQRRKPEGDSTKVGGAAADPFACFFTWSEGAPSNDPPRPGMDAAARTCRNTSLKPRASDQRGRPVLA